MSRQLDQEYHLSAFDKILLTLVCCASIWLILWLDSDEIISLDSKNWHCAEYGAEMDNSGTQISSSFCVRWERKQHQ